MGNFDIKSAKYLIAVIAICFIFLIAVGNAYKYLPDNNQKNNVTSEQINENNDYNNLTESQTESDYEEDSTTKKDYSKNVKQFEDTDLDDENNSDKIVSDSKETVDVFLKPKELVKDKKYESAIIAYQDISEMTSDDETKAKCYEEISILYAGMKRYNNALMYAQKAYNLKPTTDRDILLCRIYYKTGQQIKAEARIQALVKKDFTLE